VAGKNKRPFIGYEQAPKDEGDLMKLNLAFSERARISAPL